MHHKTYIAEQVYREYIHPSGNTSSQKRLFHN